MLYVGPEVLTGYFSNGSLLAGGAMGLLGPAGVQWVFLAHEGLSITTIGLSQGGTASVSYLTPEGLGDLEYITPTGPLSMGYIFSGTATLGMTEIDDVSFVNMTANGAEVKQWQQPS